MNRKAVYGLIRGLVGQANVIVIPRLFVKLADGDYETAAFLAQCVYWSDYAKADGWFYKSYSEWSDELELSEYHIRKATAFLVSKGVLQTDLRMVSRRPLVHYRVDVDAIAARLEGLLEVDSEKIAESDSEKISESMIVKNFENPLTVEYTEGYSDPFLRNGSSATPQQVPLLDIREWPDKLTPRHVQALVDAGYTPDSAKSADPQTLLALPNIGVQAVKILTGVDLAVTSQVPPAIKTVQIVFGRYPSKMLWRRIEDVVGDTPDEDLMKTAYETWCARGYNPNNLDGWLSWYKDGIPQPRGQVARPPARKDRTNENPTNGTDNGRASEDYAARIEAARDRASRNGVDLAAIPAA